MRKGPLMSRKTRNGHVSLHERLAFMLWHSRFASKHVTFRLSKAESSLAIFSPDSTISSRKASRSSRRESLLISIAVTQPKRPAIRLRLRPVAHQPFCQRQWQPSQFLGIDNRRPAMSPMPHEARPQFLNSRSLSKFQDRRMTKLESPMLRLKFIPKLPNAEIWMFLAASDANIMKQDDASWANLGKPCCKVAGHSLVGVHAIYVEQINAFGRRIRLKLRRSLCASDRQRRNRWQSNRLEHGQTAPQVLLRPDRLLSNGPRHNSV